MDMAVQVAVGVIVIVLLGFTVGPLLSLLQREAPLTAPPTIKEKWGELTEGDEGGWLLGNMERALYLGAFLLNMPEAIGAWLAFKVASKWNAWSNIIAVPQSLSGVDDLEYLIARRRWGSQLLMTFLVGTLWNILIALLGYAAGRWAI
jgi:hypothetical protein